LLKKRGWNILGFTILSAKSTEDRVQDGRRDEKYQDDDADLTVLAKSCTRMILGIADDYEYGIA
jgi:hypothetical protein